MAFGDIPIRQNGKGFLIKAEWFNSIRTELVNAFGSGGYVKETQVQTISNGGTFIRDPSAFKEMMNVQSDGGTVTTADAPFGTNHGFLGGGEVLLVGQSNTDVVEIPVKNVAGGFVGKGKIILSQYETVLLIYNAQLDRFFRQGDR